MASVKAYKFGDSESPAFPEEFDIVKKAVLQVTDIKTNHNKYYAVELHKGKVGGKDTFRVFTHYGRTDDLETNPNAGQKECRFFDSAGEAEANYLTIYREKTSAKKGYKEVALASSKIGSQKARGTSAGQIDAKTADKIAKKPDAAPKPSLNLHKDVQDIVSYLYSEATTALTNTVAATITANGIETPLGVLTIGQIEKGDEILHELYEIFKKPNPDKKKMESLTSDFYTAIPHRLGRTKAAIASTVINTLEAFQSKQETLQLMKDMLQVNGDAGVLFGSEIESKYTALGCNIETLEKGTPEFAKLDEQIQKSLVKMKKIKVQAIHKLKRPGEWDTFDSKVGNEQLMFHGSNIKNWVGILSRGILLPKIVVSMGVNRTDEGWLGSGIYFGSNACTSAFYCHAGKRGTSVMAVARVGLGKVKDYNKITYGINEPPKGFDSCHGVSKRHAASEFDDDEYVVYRGNQQRLEYLVEFN